MPPFIDRHTLPGFPLWLKYLDGLFIRPVRVVILEMMLRVYDSQKPELTALIALRNRVDNRLRNLLESLCFQTYPHFQTLIVDYSSEPEAAKELEILASNLKDCHLLRIEGKSEWNRSQALNLGLNHVTTPYVLILDADLVLAPDYIEKAIQLLFKERRSIVVSYMWDLSRPSSQTIKLKNLDELKKKASRRFKNDPYHPSIIATQKKVLSWVGGYDERFRLWGGEDRDLMARLLALGFKTNLLDDSYFLHQWHPKHEGVQTPELKEVIKANHYLAAKRKWFFV